MTDFLRAAAAVLIALLVCVVLSKHGKDFTVLITVLLCCMVFHCATAYLEPVVDFVGKLKELSGIDSQILQILLKSVGVGVLSEIMVLICTDAGYATMGKAIQFLSAAVMLWLSIPLLNSLMDLVEKILVAA